MICFGFVNEALLQRFLVLSRQQQVLQVLEVVLMWGSGFGSDWFVQIIPQIDTGLRSEEFDVNASNQFQLKKTGCSVGPAGGAVVLQRPEEPEADELAVLVLTVVTRSSCLSERGAARNIRDFYSIRN